MSKNYNLEWFDILVSVTLNPGKAGLTSISENHIQTILSEISSEAEKLRTVIKNEVFNLNKESQIELLIKKYHSTLIILLDNAFENKQRAKTKSAVIDQVFKVVITSLDELLSFIEVRFSPYLSLDERVPVTYLSVSKKELRQRLNNIGKKLYSRITDRRLVDIVLNTLYAFTNKTKQDYSVTVREMLYIKELIKELEVLEDPEKDTCLYTALNELLIYLNFNSKAFANYFTHRLAEKINKSENISDKFDQLLMHFKEFNQMHRKPDVKLNPQFRDLKTVLSNWFLQEIFYLEKKMHLSVKPLQGEIQTIKNQSMTSQQKQKVLCILSSDQTGLIIRAADELRILVAKSMSEVFKTIVPHLSTPYREDLSYDGMRSKSYVAEERDKQIAIETLERIIKKIKEY